MRCDAMRIDDEDPNGQYVVYAKMDGVLAGVVILEVVPVQVVLST